MGLAVYHCCCTEREKFKDGKKGIIRGSEQGDFEQAILWNTGLSRDFSDNRSTRSIRASAH